MTDDHETTTSTEFDVSGPPVGSSELLVHGALDEALNFEPVSGCELCGHPRYRNGLEEHTPLCAQVRELLEWKKWASKEIHRLTERTF